MPHSAATLVRRVPPNRPATPDLQLLREFATARSEDAFAELVRRHGPMVLAACRRVLGNSHDADDAFQAAFLVLARKADSVRGSTVTAWLYTVAVRSARGVRIMRDRRRKHETVASGLRPTTAAEAPHDPDLAAVIDEELAHLSEPLRAVVVLCELRGLSRKDAAAELGIPEGTLSSRLASAKRKLAERLSARGLAVPAAIGGVLSATAVSARLMTATVCALRGSVQPLASAAAATVVKAMLFDQLKAVVLAAGVMLTLVCGGLAMTGNGGDEPGNVPAPRGVEDPAAKLVAQLGSADFAEREAAATALRELGPKAEAALRAGLKSESAEVRERVAKLLAAIRIGVLNALVKGFDPKGTAEPDHPIWKRFKTVAGNDAPARLLFAELIADPARLRMLDEANRDPEHAGELYATEIDRYYATLEVLWRERIKNMNLPERPWADTVAILYVGTYPTSTGKTRGESNREMHLFRTWPEELHTPAGPAVRRVFTAWLALRDHPPTVTFGIQKAAWERITEARGVIRTVAADEKFGPIARAMATAYLANSGTHEDVALLRRVAESKAANEPFEPFEVILSGREELDRLSQSQFRFGAKPVTPEQWEEARKKADIRKCDRALADCAWAAAICLAGGKPEDMGFLWPYTATKGPPFLRPKFHPNLLYDRNMHGFETPAQRTAAYTKAKEFLDKLPPEEPKPDPVVMKLVEQLGTAEFAEREAAATALRELGSKAKSALRAGLRSESAEVRERSANTLATIRKDQVWGAFKKVAGDDKDARELFAKIMGSPRAVNAIEAALDAPSRVDELYRVRTAELLRIAAGHPPVDGEGKASVPSPRGVWVVAPAPLGDTAGWMLLGTLQSGTSDWRAVTHPDWANALSSHIAFLPEDDYTSARSIAEAYMVANAAPLKKLTAAWLLKRRENDTLRAGLALAIRYDIKDALPAARVVLKEAKPSAIASPNLAAVAVFVGLHGTKDDLPLLARHATDDRSFGSWLNLPPGTDVQFAPPAKEGRDLFCHVRDAVAVSMCKLAGKNPADFGFPAFPATKHPNGNPISLTSATKIGFTTKDARAAAFEKAKEWIESHKREEKKPEDTPVKGAKVWPHFAKVIGDDKDSRALFDTIISDAKNLELLEKAADGDRDLLKLYRAHRDELNVLWVKCNNEALAAARNPPVRRFPIIGAEPPDPPGGVPVANTAGWLLLGTFPGTTGDDVDGPRPNFLTIQLAQTGLARALDKGPMAKPLRKLVAVWLTTRGDERLPVLTGLDLATMFDIPDALPAARRLVEQPAAATDRWEQLLIRSFALGVVGKYGTKADATLVARFAADATLVEIVHPEKGTIRPGDAVPVDGRDRTTEMRDVALAALVRLHGGEQMPTAFKSKADREAAHKKAKAFLDEQKKLAEKEARPLRQFDGHTNSVTGVAFFPTSSKVVTSAFDTTYRIWDATTGKELAQRATASKDSQMGGPVAISPDGKRIAARYFVADADTGKLLFDLEGHIAEISRIHYSADGKHILTASYDGTIRLREADTGNVVRTIEAHMGHKVPAGPRNGFGPNPVVGPGGEPPAEHIVGRGVRDVALSPDGKRIVSGGIDGRVRVWDAETGKEIWGGGVSQDLLSVAFLPDGKRIVTGAMEGDIRIWDAAASKELKKLTGHTGGVDALAVSPDGRFLVSAGADTTVRVWDIETGREGQCFRGHTGPVRAVAVSPDGKTVLSAGEDKTARLWAMPGVK